MQTKREYIDRSLRRIIVINYPFFTSFFTMFKTDRLIYSLFEFSLNTMVLNIKIPDRLHIVDST